MAHGPNSKKKKQASTISNPGTSLPESKWKELLNSVRVEDERFNSDETLAQAAAVLHAVQQKREDTIDDWAHAARAIYIAQTAQNVELEVTHVVRMMRRLVKLKLIDEQLLQRS
jgi:hypothetical protein